MSTPEDRGRFQFWLMGLSPFYNKTNQLGASIASTPLCSVLSCGTHWVLCPLAASTRTLPSPNATLIFLGIDLWTWKLSPTLIISHFMVWYDIDALLQFDFHFRKPLLELFLLKLNNLNNLISFLLFGYKLV